ncbi:MAG TPA: hypothetical protein PKA98_23380, partial [Acidimicrobiales bacterium]|nr:hypothetical protein [Acidimicrobiales bacterium]
MELDGARVLVTGASSGIGAATRRPARRPLDAPLPPAAQGDHAHLLPIERQLPHPHVAVAPRLDPPQVRRQLLDELPLGQFERQNHPPDDHAGMRDDRLDRVERVGRRHVHVGGQPAGLL